MKASLLLTILLLLSLPLPLACRGGSLAVPVGQDATPESDDSGLLGPFVGAPTEDDAGPSPWTWALDDEAGEASSAPLGRGTSNGPAPSSLGSAASPPSPDGACASPLAPGDLAIDELMIESVAGAGDYGEWIEVASQRSCAVNLRGLHGDCPSGAKVRSFDVSDDVWIPPFGTFVVADAANPATNHDLPVPLLVWSGHPGDVLRNKGGTVDLLVGGDLIDSVTYPSLKLTVGASIAFPADCDPSLRMDFTTWQTSTATYFPGFFGTPNGPNTDVACAVSPAADPDAGDEAGP